MVEQSVGLKDLKFEIDPGVSEREMQPVMDAHGRIAGFLTWDKAHPMLQAMQRLMPFIAGIAIVLVGFAGFSLWQLAPRAARTGGERGAGARAPPTRTSSPACPITPRRSNCSTSRWPSAPATT